MKIERRKNMARKNDDSRSRWTFEKVKGVLAMHKGGAKTGDIVDVVGLGTSTVQNIVRSAKLIVEGDYVTLLKEFSVAKTEKLTDYSIRKAEWLCKAIGVRPLTEKELQEAFDELLAEKHGTSSLFDGGDVPPIYPAPDTADYSDLWKIKESLIGVIDYIDRLLGNNE